MITDETGKALHDRASRGEKLTGEEKHQLESWYARMDEAESALIAKIGEEATPTGLQAQIEGVLAQLIELTNRIQEVAAENEALRSENAKLLRRLTQQSGRQSA